MITKQSFRHMPINKAELQTFLRMINCNQDSIKMLAEITIKVGLLMKKLEFPGTRFPNVTKLITQFYSGLL